MQSKPFVASLGLVLVLAACSNNAAGRGARPDARDGSDGTASAGSQAGFGGVVEVTFATQDATAQDALARECGLVDESLIPLTATPPSLPPQVRWYQEPPDADAAIACMKRQQDVLGVLLPR